MRVHPLNTLLLLSPATVLLLVFLLGPVAVVAVLSLTDWQFGAATLNWVGLANYAELWSDPVFRQSLANTLLYLVLVTAGAVAIGLGTALLIESDTQLRGFYRTAFFMPVASTLIAMAVVWQFLLHPSAGLVNHMLQWVGLQPQDWLNNRRLALYSLAAIGVWQMAGLAMVLFLAGLKSIPQDVRDAAALDGVTAASPGRCSGQPRCSSSPSAPSAHCRCSTPCTCSRAAGPTSRPRCCCTPSTPKASASSAWATPAP